MCGCLSAHECARVVNANRCLLYQQHEDKITFHIFDQRTPGLSAYAASEHQTVNGEKMFRLAGKQSRRD